MQAPSILADLAKAESFPSATGLLSAHLDDILALLSPAATWHERTPDLAVFCLVKSHVAVNCQPGIAEK